MGTSPPLAVRLLCEPAWGPHADRRATRLISREAEGSPTGAYSQPTGSLTPRWLTLQSGYGRNTPVSSIGQRNTYLDRRTWSDDDEARISQDKDFSD